MLTATARRCRRENSSGARSPARAAWARSRAAWASGRSTCPAYTVPRSVTASTATTPHRSAVRSRAASGTAHPSASTVATSPNP